MDLEMTDDGAAAAPDAPQRAKTSHLPDRVSGLCRAARDLLRFISPREIPSITPHDQAVLQRFVRSSSLFDAAILLLNAGLMEEGLIVSRSLFEESLHLAELEDAGQERAALVVAAATKSVQEKWGLMHEAKRLGLDDDVDTIIRALDDERRKIDRYLSRRGLPLRSSPRRSYADLAMRYGRKDDLWTYYLSHEMVHGSDAAWLYRRKKVDGTVALANRTTDAQTLTAAAAFAIRSVLHSARAASDMFGWNARDLVEGLIEQVALLEENTPA